MDVDAIDICRLLIMGYAITIITSHNNDHTLGSFPTHLLTLMYRGMELLWSRASGPGVDPRPGQVHWTRFSLGFFFALYGQQV